MFHISLQEKLQIIFPLTFAQKLCQPASRAAGESSWQAKVCTIRKSWKKTQLHCTIALYDGSGAVHFLRQISAMMGPARFIFASIMSAFTAKKYCWSHLLKNTNQKLLLLLVQNWLKRSRVVSGFEKVRTVLLSNNEKLPRSMVQTNRNNALAFEESCSK